MKNINPTQKENSWNIKKAKDYIFKLHKNNLAFHFDDGAVDCLYKNNVCSLKEAKRIDRNLDEIYKADLDWGEHNCPIGYLLFFGKTLKIVRRNNYE